jgi:hypothetical protein
MATSTELKDRLDKLEVAFAQLLENHVHADNDASKTPNHPDLRDSTAAVEAALPSGVRLVKTFEILEAILLELPDYAILSVLPMQAVSRTFKETVANSSRLQRRLVFTPPDQQPGPETELNTLLLNKRFFERCTSPSLRL